MKRVAALAVLLAIGLCWQPAPVDARDCNWGVFPDSDSRFLEEGELLGMTSQDLWRAKNEIYARRGYIFSTAQAADYAGSLCYYQGTTRDMDRVARSFNRFERSNLALILAAMEGGDTAPDTTVPPSPLDSPWIFPDSDMRALTHEDLAPLNRDELWRARNEIYARHGYIFSSARGQAYARSLGSYYRGTDRNAASVARRFNRFEEYNVNLIKKYEGR